MSDDIIIHGDVIVNLTSNNEELEPITPKNDVKTSKLRNTIAMNTLKKKVKQRDSACQCCGSDGKGHLEVHHIMPLSKYPDLGLDEMNLITLCQKCHKLYHTQYAGSESSFTFANFMRDNGVQRL